MGNRQPLLTVTSNDQGVNRSGGTMPLGKRREGQNNLREGMIPEWV